MTVYATLSDLRDAYHSGDLDAQADVLTIDNDSTTVYSADGEVFEMHPADLLRQALDLLGIPHEPA
jgi:hypothetical protein